MLNMDKRSHKVTSKFGLSNLNAACLSKSADVVAALLDEDQSNDKKRDQIINHVTGEQGDADGWTPVHLACINKNNGAAILQLLVSRGFTLQALTSNGSSPLHEACRNGNNDCVRFVLEHLRREDQLHPALELKNKDGNTPLHLACRAGHREVVNTLLNYGYHRSVQNHIRGHSMCPLNSDNATPLGLAIAGSHLGCARLLVNNLPSGNPATVVKDFSSFCPHDNYKQIESLRVTECQPIDVFFLGDSESGKSTLIKTLHTHSQSTLSALYTLLPYVNHPADKHKVGIVPIAIEYPRRNHQCPIVFHDVTGHRSYAHEAIIKCTENPLDSLFVVTVDIRASEEVIKGKLLYWFNFLTYVVSQYHSKSRSPTMMQRSESDAKLQVVVIGNFNDLVSRFSSSGSQAMLTALCRVISDENPDLLSHFEWKGSYALNACKAYSWKIHQLRSVLQEQCQHIHFSDSCHFERVSLPSYLLAAIVSDHLVETSASVTTFERVIEYVKNCDNISCRLLRREDGDVDRVLLMELCRSLKRFKQFSIYETSHSSPNLHKRFIIHDLYQLLSSINTAIDGLSGVHLNGIVSHTDLLTAFQEVNFPPGFIIEFMESFQICEGVTADGLKHMRQRIRTSRRSLNSRSSLRSQHTPRRQSSFNTPPVVQVKSEHHGTLSSCDTPPTPDMKRGHHRTLSSCDTPPTPRSRRGHHRASSLSFPLTSETSKTKGDQSLSETPSHSSFQPEQVKNEATSGTSPQSSLTAKKPSRRHSSRLTRHKDIPYCYFPTLLSSKPPAKWGKDYDKYAYGFAWSMSPKNGTYYFPPRFVTNLLFRLLHAFAPFKTGALYQHEKVCDLWTWGIMWQDSNGTRACVTVHENQTITLSMQCLQGQEVECLKLRNLVVTEIMSQKNDLHPEIQMTDVLIPDDQRATFPIYEPADAPACFDKMEIGAAIVSGELVLNCTERKNHVKLADLLYLEPLTLLPGTLLQQLLDVSNQDEKMSDEFCLDFSKEIHVKWQLLATYFGLHQSYISEMEREREAKNMAPCWAALRIMEHLRDSVGEEKGVHTYRELKESLLDISIFTEEELNEFVNFSLYASETEDSTDDLAEVVVL